MKNNSVRFANGLSRPILFLLSKTLYRETGAYLDSFLHYAEI